MVTGDVDDEYVQITRRNNSVVAFMKNSFVRLNMTWHEFFFGSRYTHINFDICIPSELCNASNVRGHLGNCDGIMNNDTPGDDECKWFLKK